LLFKRACTIIPSTIKTTEIIIISIVIVIVVCFEHSLNYKKRSF
jgi:hypothetical protein